MITVPGRNRGDVPGGELASTPTTEATERADIGPLS